MQIPRAAILASLIKGEATVETAAAANGIDPSVVAQIASGYRIRVPAARPTKNEPKAVKQLGNVFRPKYARFDEGSIRAAAARGENYYQIAEANNTHYNTIRKFCKSRGIETVKMHKGVCRALNAEQVAQAMRMVKRGIPTRTIAAKFGIQARSLRRYYLKPMGIVGDGRKEWRNERSTSTGRKTRCSNFPR